MDPTEVPLPTDCSLMWSDIERAANAAQTATVTLTIGSRVISGTTASSLLADYRKALAAAVSS